MQRRYQSIQLDENKWFQQYKYLTENEPLHVLLESGRGGDYSIIGLKPFATVSGKGDRLICESNDEVKELRGSLLTSLKECLAPYTCDRVEGLPPFQGGAIGYISYDLVREIEELPNTSEDDLNLPDLYFMLFSDVFIYDHRSHRLWIIVMGQDVEALDKQVEYYLERWTAPSSTKKWLFEGGGQQVKSSMTEKEFSQAVEKIKAYIGTGDVFQVNLSLRQSRPLTVEPLHVYETLREVNPSPYMSYLETPMFQFVSASPELLVKKNGDELSTRPIAGTRSRGKDDAEDEALAETLINNEKERAEHVMLVDLERNDLGRVSAYGSVEVDELMVIEKYSHVMHIVSNVKGTLADNNDLYDVIRATFPGGTITGAPKVRTMEIIEELEPVRRGVYTGSIGWIGFDGNMELNIAIRTMVCKDGYAHVQAGAGVVIDSIPENEYKESLKKAKALWHALEVSEDEMRKMNVSMS